jgi:hypothetical protein
LFVSSKCEFGSQPGFIIEDQQWELAIYEPDFIRSKLT